MVDMVGDPEMEEALVNGSIRSVLPMGSLLSPSGTEVQLQELEGKVIGLYFAANWYPKCEAFTPALAAAYQQLKERNADFEVVFVSCDEDRPSFERFHRDMLWPAVPFGDLRCKKRLSQRFQVEGIPRLVIIAPNGDVIHSDAVELVNRYGDRAFPFTSARVAELEEDEQRKYASQTLEKLFSISGTDYVNGGKEQVKRVVLESRGPHLEPNREDGRVLLLGAPVCAVHQVHREAGRHIQQPERQVRGFRDSLHTHGQGGGRVPAVVQRHAVAGADVRRHVVAGAGQVLRRPGDPDAGGGRARREDGDEGGEEPGEPLLRHGVPVHRGADQAAAGDGGRGSQGIPAVPAPHRAPPRAEHRVGQVGGRAVHLLRVRRAGARLGVPVHRLRLRDTPQVRPERGRRQCGGWLAHSPSTAVLVSSILN